MNEITKGHMMDGQRFDRWTKLLESRPNSCRGLLRLALGAGVALAGGGLAPDDALACRRTSRACDRDGQCCSGICTHGRAGVKK